MEKVNWLWILVAALLAGILGVMIGYSFMPDKIVVNEKLVKANCTATKCIMPTCEKCKVCPVPEKCTYEKARNQGIEDKKAEVKTKIFTMTSTRSCKDYLANSKISKLPSCLVGKQITGTEDIKEGCLISYKIGFC